MQTDKTDRYTEETDRETGKTVWGVRVHASYLVSRKDVYQVVFVVVERIGGARLQGHLARDPIVVLRQQLVALGRGLEGRVEAIDLATRLAVEVWLDEDGPGLGRAYVLHGVRACWENGRGARGDLNGVRLRTRRVGDGEPGVRQKVHRVRRVRVRLVLGARRQVDDHQARARQLGEHLIRLRVARDAVEDAGAKAELGGLLGAAEHVACRRRAGGGLSSAACRGRAQKLSSVW
jgi:hypothetical protein